MPTRYIKVSFHRVEVTNAETPVSFSQILSTVHRLPNDRQRTQMLTADEPVRLRHLEEIGGRWLGDLARIRLHETIDKSTVDGEEEAIQFRDGEGPCEKTAFYYDPRLRVIAIQQTAGAVSPSSCGRYFRTIGRVQKIELPVILKLDALERALRFGVITKFQIKLAGIDNARPLRGIEDSARSMMQFLRSLRAPTASINVGIDRETPRLERIGQVVRDILRLEEDHLAIVKKLLVVGGDEDSPDEIAAIDLLKDRIMESVPIVLADGVRISDHDRYNAVRTAWNRQRQGLTALFGQN
jgi:hypothetical protein